MSGSNMKILLGWRDSTEARPGISAVELDKARRGCRNIPLAGQKQMASGGGRVH